MIYLNGRDNFKKITISELLQIASNNINSERPKTKQLGQMQLGVVSEIIENGKNMADYVTGSLYQNGQLLEHRQSVYVISGSSESDAIYYYEVENETESVGYSVPDESKINPTGFSESFEDAMEKTKTYIEISIRAKQARRRPPELILGDYLTNNGG